MKPLYFNGKFLTAAPTGVHRVAEELIQATDRLLATQPDAPETIILTPATEAKAASLTRTRVVHTPFLSGIAKNIPWEHFALPWSARKGRLISLCNLGPVFHADAITMIHDAQVYLTPDSYSRGFRLWYRFLLPLIGKTSRRILTVSEFSRQQLVRFGVATADRIDVIHNGCDHVLAHEPDSTFVAASGLKKGRYVLALANTQAHKNIAVLLKAFADPRLADMTLVLFGAAKREDFERLGMMVPANIHFAGRINDAQLTGLIAGACAFACPSTTEGFGLPPLEAMILGCPAIVAPCGALPEVCGDAALTAAAHDPNEWVDQIRALADDAGFSAQMRARGRTHAAAFTWDRAARKLALLLGLKVDAHEEADRPHQPVAAE